MFRSTCVTKSLPLCCLGSCRAFLRVHLVWVLNGPLFLELVSVRAAHTLWADFSTAGQSWLCCGAESREHLIAADCSCGSSV